MVRIVSEAHGTGAGTTIRTGAVGPTVRGDITATTPPGTTEVSMIRGTTAVSMTHGITEDTGEVIMPAIGAGTTLGITITTITGGTTRILITDHPTQEVLRSGKAHIKDCVPTQKA